MRGGAGIRRSVRFGSGSLGSCRADRIEDGKGSVPAQRGSAPGQSFYCGPRRSAHWASRLITCRHLASGFSQVLGLDPCVRALTTTLHRVPLLTRRSPSHQTPSQRSSRMLVPVESRLSQEHLMARRKTPEADGVGSQTGRSQPCGASSPRGGDDSMTVNADSDTTANWAPVNILLVDDTPAKLLTYEVVLAELGEKLIKANSVEEALRILLK